MTFVAAKGPNNLSASSVIDFLSFLSEEKFLSEHPRSFGLVSHEVRTNDRGEVPRAAGASGHGREESFADGRELKKSLVACW